jgi:Zn-dependent protease with chaperone function
VNFFERQVVARRNSQLLLGLFFLGTLLVILGLDAGASLLWYVFRFFTYDHPKPPPGWLHLLVFVTATSTIAFTSIAKTLEVYQGGGLAVARMMDARQVVPVNASPLEKRLLNIVEEMAIAAGTRVPIVFVMDQAGGINAFAAGFDGKLCAIVVTRGALQNLNRAELQGVIAHEFSHIVHGDMAFNLQMIGVLSGLTFIGAAGDHLLRSSPEVSRGDFRAGFFVFVAGMTLLLAGYLGLFAGKAIKAKIAREREYGADAGSLQLTRDPQGLAGALDQLRRHHSTVLHLHTEDVSHLFFGEALYLEEERLLSTHPTIADRIERLAPDFTPDKYRDWRVDPVVELERSIRPAPRPFEDESAPATPADVVALVGSSAERHVQAATVLVASLPAPARAALQTRDGAAALAIALVMSSREAVAAQETTALRAAGFETLASAALLLLPVVASLPEALHLPAQDIALAELLRQPDAYRGEIVRALDAIVAADSDVSVHRYASLNLMRSQLEPGARPAGNKPLDALRDDVALLLSLVAYAGCRNKDDFDQAFAAGAKEMELEAVAPQARERCDAQALDAALGRLRDLAPIPKARLIRGYYAAIGADGLIGPVEIALLRMMGAVLDCPIPPIDTQARNARDTAAVRLSTPSFS